MKTTSLLILLFISTSTTWAQDLDLITDRPDQTESAATVPAKSLQVESGYVYEKAGNIQTNTYNTTLLRYGLLENMELRLGAEYIGEDISGLQSQGFGPLHLGFKIKILEENGLLPELAFLGGMDMPFIAEPDFQAKHNAANMRFALAYTLSDHYSLGINVGSEWNGNNTVPAYFYSIALGIGLTDELGMFVEFYGNLIENNASEHLADAGFTYLISPLFQVDLSAGVGLNDNALDSFVSLGLSFRLPQ